MRRELDIRHAKPKEKPYKIFIGRGLYVAVQPTGSKLWRFKYHFVGKEKLLSFGRYPEVSWATANKQCDEARAMLRLGRDPALYCGRGSRKSEMSFEHIARAWYAKRSPALVPAHAARVLSRLESDVFPMIGAQLITAIRAPEILGIVRRVEARGAVDTAHRLKQMISQIFRFAIVNDWADDDPAAHLTGALHPLPRRQHMARLKQSHTGVLVDAIRTYDADPTSGRSEVTRHALMFTLLTWARTGEVRFAKWSEFEGLEGEAGEALWRVPAERMKMRHEHLVPLSHQAVALLHEIAPERRRRGLVFKGEKPGTPVSANTMIYACYRMGFHRTQTVHGFRGLASTWANESGRYSPDWIEAALAHQPRDAVRAAYNGAYYLDARREMLQEWADYLDSLGIDDSREKQVIVMPDIEYLSQLSHVSSSIG